jgi:hypothetical protein
MSDKWLESWSWGAQLGLFVLAVAAIFVAWRQLTAYKVLELMKYIEDEEFRSFRRTVILEIKNYKETEWWDWKNARAEKFETAASGVCARYDILALMIFTGIYARPSRHGKFFIHNWRLSIIDTHDALTPYLKHRRRPPRRTAYDQFSKLRDWAVRDARRDGLMLDVNENSFDL